MSLVTVDQIISGASNIAVLIFIAHVLDPSDFGLFSLLYLSFAIALVIVRSLVSTAVLAHPEDAEHRAGSVLGSTGVLASALGALFGCAGLVLLPFNAGIGAGLLVLAALSPLLLVQDVGRYLAIATARPTRAIRLDLAWLGLEAVGFLALVAWDAESLVSCVAVWAGSGALAGCLVFFQHSVPARHDLRPGWLRERWSFSWRSFLAGVTEQAGVLLALVVIASVATAQVVAAVQAVTLLTRPGYTVILAIGQSTVADVARDRPRGDAIWAYVRRAIGITAVVAVGNLAAMVLLPDSLGTAILGRTWPLAEPLLLATGLQIVLLSARSGLRAALLGRREIRLILVLDVAGTVFLMPLLVVGAVINGALGVAWAGAVGQAVLSIGWWLVAVPRLRRSADYGEPPTQEASPGRSRVD